MTTTSVTRVDDELFASAKVAGEVMQRSASQQLAHWARIGRELELGDSVRHREITSVLAGRKPYDSLSVHEQAVVRAAWAERARQLRESLDLLAEFTSRGEIYTTVADDGSVLRVGPDGEDVIGSTDGAPAGHGPTPGKRPAARTSAARSAARTAARSADRSSGRSTARR